MSVFINNNGNLDPVAGNGIQNTFTGTEAEVTAAMAAGEIAEGTVVYITDDNGVGVNAGDVTYDNTDSGLTATNVQSAIDEVENVLDGLSGDVEDIQTALSDKADKNYVERNALGSSTAIPDQEGSQYAYTFPFDGYVKIVANSGAIYYKLAGSNGVELEIKVDSGEYNLIYVRKGMKMFKSGGTGSMSAVYRPLTE